MSAYPLRRAPAVEELPLFAGGHSHGDPRVDQARGPLVDGGESRSVVLPESGLDLARGLELRDEGIARVAASEPKLIDRLRAEAKRVSAARGWVHVDDLRLFVMREGLTVHRNLWGAIFAGRGWVRVGEKASEIESNHGHRSPIWRWRGE